jgi:hypothetical protein
MKYVESKLLIEAINKYIFTKLPQELVEQPILGKITVK